jgi:hypothetical protein
LALERGDQRAGAARDSRVQPSEQRVDHCPSFDSSVDEAMLR